jgi:hypothetical protein
MCNNPGFQCSDNAVKSRKRIENKRAYFWDLRQRDSDRVYCAQALLDILEEPANLTGPIAE